MKAIDLRSDTVTKPSIEMRKFMTEAEVGDDVYGEDPTINKLQEMAAEVTGKEAALYVPSGSMANQIAIKSLTEMGDEVLIGEKSHCYLYESGAGPAIAGIQFTQIGKGGLFSAEEVQNSIKEDNHHYTPTTLISCENTHNRGGGRIFKLDEIKKIRAVADKHKIKMHLDGARIFNASMATGIKVKEYAKCFDTISFCLSKGLGAPVGSLVCSTKERVIGKLHRYRKMFGGGMRQAGILAAAGIYALKNNVERLAQDHEHAKMLAKAISSSKYFEIDENEVETNILIFSISKTYSSKLTASDISGHFAKKGILFSPISTIAMRMVTHLDVSREEIEKTISELNSLNL